MKIKSKSFALMELLVVIIGILVSLLLPNLREAREKAKIAVCLSNLKQQGTALAQYTANHSGRFPFIAFYHDYANSYSMRKVGVDYPGLNPYLDPATEGVKGQNIKTPMKVLECPSDKGDPVTGWGKMPADRTAFENWGNSYIVQRVGQWNLGTFVNSTSYNFTTKTYYPRGDDDIAYSKPRLYEYDRLDRKITVHNVNTRPGGGRFWADDRTRWHNQKFSDTRLTTLFMDGHSEYFNFWWRAGDKAPGGRNIDRDNYH